jgi:hypothetical protein
VIFYGFFIEKSVELFFKAVLLDMLQPFANHGTMLRTLYAYVEDTQQKYDGACIDGRTSALLDFVLCVQSFCASFRDFLAKLRSDLNRCLAKGGKLSDNSRKLFFKHRNDLF